MTITKLISRKSVLKLIFVVKIGNTEFRTKQFVFIDKYKVVLPRDFVDDWSKISNTLVREQFNFSILGINSNYKEKLVKLLHVAITEKKNENMI